MADNLLKLYLAAVTEAMLGDAPLVSVTPSAAKRYRQAVAERRRAKERWREARAAGHTQAAWLTPL